MIYTTIIDEVMVQAEIEENEPVMQNENEIYITILSFQPEDVYTKKELEKLVIKDYKKQKEIIKLEKKLEMKLYE